MASKIPRLVSTREAARTDYEKLSVVNGARPKQTVVKSSKTVSTGGTPEIKEVKQIENEPKLKRNKSVLGFGVALKPKFTKEKNNMKFNIHCKESTGKGCAADKENVKVLKKKRMSCESSKENNKQLVVNDHKPDNIKKTEVLESNKISNKQKNSAGFTGLTFLPKERRSGKSSLELHKSMRRSKTEADLKIGTLERKTGELNDILIDKTNKSKTLDRRDIKSVDILSPEFSDSMENELCQKLLPSNCKSHGGMKFIPKQKKKKSLVFNFNKDPKTPE